MNSSAYVRGIKTASALKRLTYVYIDADSRFAAWADSKGVPRAIGRSFVPFSVLVLLALALVAGFFLGGIILAVAGFAYLVRYIQISNLAPSDSDDSTSEHGPEYRNGRDGYGYYYSADDSIFTSPKSHHEED